MKAGFSNTTLIKKLGIKAGFSVLLVHEPIYYYELLGTLPEGVRLVGKGIGNAVDFIHFFAKNRETLNRHFPVLKAKLKKNGQIWVSWIKTTSQLQTDIRENDVRNLGLELGLVDVKICAIDSDWSGLKFVYRKQDRQKAGSL